MKFAVAVNPLYTMVAICFGCGLDVGDNYTRRLLNNPKHKHIQTCWNSFFEQVTAGVMIAVLPSPRPRLRTCVDLVFLSYDKHAKEAMKIEDNLMKFLDKMAISHSTPRQTSSAPSVLCQPTSSSPDVGVRSM